MLFGKWIFKKFSLAIYWSQTNYKIYLGGKIYQQSTQVIKIF